MATKADKKNAIRQDIIDSAAIYSQSLAGKAFLYVYGEDFFEVSFPVDHFLHLTGVETKLSAKDFFLPMSLRVEDSSVEKSKDGEIVDFIFSKDASIAKYDTLLVEDKNKMIPDNIKHLISEKLYSTEHD